MFIDGLESSKFKPLSQTKQWVDALVVCLYFVYIQFSVGYAYCSFRQRNGIARALSRWTSYDTAPALFLLCYYTLLIYTCFGCCKSFVLVMDKQHLEKCPQQHIGSVIKEELERQERTVSWFARKLCCDRSNVYKIFKRTTIDTELLLRISKILNRNFFDLFSEQVCSE